MLHLWTTKIKEKILAIQNEPSNITIHDLQELRNFIFIRVEMSFTNNNWIRRCIYDDLENI